MAPKFYFWSPGQKFFKQSTIKTQLTKKQEEHEALLDQEFHSR